MLVKIENNGSATTELCLLEFQGAILGELPGNELGPIRLLQGGIAEIEVGPYILEGSVVKLKSPLLVTEKAEIATTNIDSSSSTKLEMRGIVRNKVIFKSRPKPKPMSV